MFLIPYILSSLILFFTLIEKDNSLLKVIQEASKVINVSNDKFLFFMIVLVIVGNLFVFFVTFLLLKIILLIFGLKKKYDQDLFISLLMSGSLINLAAIAIITMMSVNRIGLSVVTSTVEIILFLLLFYSNTKDLKATKVLFYGKILFLLTNIGALLILK